MYPICKNSRPHDIIKAIKYHYGSSADNDIVRHVLMYHNGVTDASRLTDNDVLGCVRADLESIIVSDCPSFLQRFMHNLQDGLRTFKFPWESEKTPAEIVLDAYLHAVRMTKTSEFTALLPLPECDPDLLEYLQNANVIVD